MCPQKCPQNRAAVAVQRWTIPDIVLQQATGLQEIYGCCWNRLEVKLVEAGGIEPPSEGLPSNMTTCLAVALISLLEPPAAGSLGASRFGFQPHPLRQENQPIPLNDVLSSPVGESR